MPLNTAIAPAKDEVVPFALELRARAGALEEAISLVQRQGGDTAELQALADQANADAALLEEEMLPASARTVADALAFDATTLRESDFENKDIADNMNVAAEIMLQAIVRQAEYETGRGLAPWILRTPDGRYVRAGSLLDAVLGAQQTFTVETEWLHRLLITDAERVARQPNNQELAQGFLDMLTVESDRGRCGTCDAAGCIGIPGARCPACDGVGRNQLALANEWLRLRRDLTLFGEALREISEVCALDLRVQGHEFGCTQDLAAASEELGQRQPLAWKMVNEAAALFTARYTPPPAPAPTAVESGGNKGSVPF